MARIKHVKNYRGRAKCQHPNTEGYGVCGQSKRADLHPTDHEFDPGQPKRCQKCGEPINIGDSYKHVTTRPTPVTSRRMERCASCPSWKASELTSSEFRAIILRADEEVPDIVYEFDDPEDAVPQLEARRDHYAEAAREAAEIRTEAAQAIEVGFGHETSQSEELREEGEEAEYVADALDNIDIDASEVDLEDATEDEIRERIEVWIDGIEQEILNEWEAMP